MATSSPPLPKVDGSDLPFTEVSFSSDDRRAIDEFRSSLASFLSQKYSSSAASSNPLYCYLPDAPTIHSHWWSDYDAVLKQRRLIGRPLKEVSELLTKSREYHGNDDKKLREQEYNLDKWFDFDLLRFLRARKYVLPEAMKMFLSFLKFRYDFGTASLRMLPSMPFGDFFQAVSPSDFHQFDKRGGPIYISSVGDMQIDYFATICTKEMLSVSHVWDLENISDRLFNASIKMGHRVESLSFIINFDGVSLQHARCAAAFKVTAEIDQNYYPELLASMIFVNVPSFFPVLWSLTKAFLDKKTQNKVKVFEKKHIHRLQELIDINNVPNEWGGKCTNDKCAARKGCLAKNQSIGFWGDTVPKHDESEEIINESMNDYQLKKIKNGKKHIVSLSILPAVQTINDNNQENNDEKSDNDKDNKPVTIWWDFSIKKHDIAFTVEFISDYATNIDTEHDGEEGIISSDETKDDEETEGAGVASSSSDNSSKKEESINNKSSSSVVASPPASSSTVNNTSTSSSNNNNTNNSTDRLIIVAPNRVNGTIRGDYQLPAGSYGSVRFIFSNHYSRWNSKEISYKVGKR